MNADERRCLTSREREELDAVTATIIGAAFEVSSAMGCGFLEKVYENALAIELRASGSRILQQARLQVEYKGQPVGDYIADLIVEGKVIVEVKSTRQLERAHQGQAMNYLRATGLKVALLLNFGNPRLEFRRVVWDF